MMKLPIKIISFSVLGCVAGFIAGICLFLLLWQLQEGWGIWLESSVFRYFNNVYVITVAYIIISIFYFIWRWGLGKRPFYKIVSALIVNVCYMTIFGVPVGSMIGLLIFWSLSGITMGGLGIIERKYSPIIVILFSIVVTYELVKYFAVKQYCTPDRH